MRPMKHRIERKLRLYAHRGSSARLPENTLEAFEQALNDGANALELDLHRSADGHFVVIHDPDGHRTAGAADVVRDLTLSELRSWNVGRVVGATDRAFRVPTLAEVLNRFPDVPMSVDLKPKDIRIVKPLLDLLADHNAEDHVTLASFHDWMVAQIRKLRYPGRTAFSRLEIAILLALPARLARFFVKGQAMQVPRSAGGLRLDSKRLLERCRTLGVRADFWVINDPDVARVLVSRGATGIMTDTPEVIAPALGLSKPDGDSNVLQRSITVSTPNSERVDAN